MPPFVLVRFGSVRFVSFVSARFVVLLLLLSLLLLLLLLCLLVQRARTTNNNSRVRAYGSNHAVGFERRAVVAPRAAAAMKTKTAPPRRPRPPRATRARVALNDGRSRCLVLLPHS